MGKYLGSGYPGGGPWTLGALSNLMPVDLSWLYQPFIAFLSAGKSSESFSLSAQDKPVLMSRCAIMFSEVRQRDENVFIQ